MPAPSPPDAVAPARSAGPWRRFLQRIPLSLRMAVYSVAFLAAVLVGLPWLAYRIDIYRPAWRVELGWGRLFGVALFVLFFLVYAVASWWLTWRGRGAYVEFDPPSQFVATGLYRYMRNPIAASLIGMLLGEALALSSTGIGLLFLVAIPLAQLQVVALEEPLLRRRFGAAYEAYLRRVPRWFPRRPGQSAR